MSALPTEPQPLPFLLIVLPLKFFKHTIKTQSNASLVQVDHCVCKIDQCLNNIDHCVQKIDHNKLYYKRLLKINLLQDSSDGIMIWSRNFDDLLEATWKGLASLSAPPHVNTINASFRIERSIVVELFRSHSIELNV